MAHTYIHNGTLIDGNGGDPVPNAAVLIEDNVIKEVGSQDQVQKPQGEVNEIDANGGFILPGMIDTHVHIMFEGLNLMQHMLSPFSLSFYNSIHFMRKTLDAGVTSVRDAGGADLGTKVAVEQGLVDGPRLQISISVLTTTGGHVDFWMRSGIKFELLVPHPGRPDGQCDGVEEVRKKVREVLRAGADIIKVCSTGGVGSPTDHPEFTQYCEEELRVMVQEAHFRKGLKVMSHAQGAEGVKTAVRAGIHSIEHGIFLDDEAIELMLKNGTYLVPTLLAPVSVIDQADSVPPWALEKAKATVDDHRVSIEKAHKAGVKIAMGTDAGVMPHGTNLRELGLMCDIGMTPMESIVATTKTAAECLGWNHLGTLETGKLADLIISKADPIADIRSLENNDNIPVVMKDGKPVKTL